MLSFFLVPNTIQLTFSLFRMGIVFFYSGNSIAQWSCSLLCATLRKKKIEGVLTFLFVFKNIINTKEIFLYRICIWNQIEISRQKNRRVPKLSCGSFFYHP